MIKNILIVFIALAASSASASEKTVESSNAYINSLLSHINKSKDTKASIDNLGVEILDAKKTAKRSAQVVVETKSSITSKETRLSSLPNKINREQNSVVEKTNKSNDSFERHFPNADSIDSVISSVSRKRRALVNEKEELQSSLRRRNRDFDERISNLERSIDNDETNKSNAQSRLDQNQRNIDLLQSEVQEARREIRRAEREKNDPNLQNRIRQAKNAFDIANQARLDKGTTCNFLSGLKKVCRRYFAARDHLARLRKIKDGSFVREKRQALRPIRDQLEDLEREQRPLEREVREYAEDIRQSERELNRVEDDKLVSTRPIRNAIAEVNFKLDSIQTKWNRVQHLVKLRDEVAGHKSNITRYQGEQTSLPSEISNLRGRLATLSATAKADADTVVILENNKADTIQAAQDALIDIEVKRTSMRLAVTEEQALLVPAGESIEEASEVIYASKRWNVLTTDSDKNWGVASCKAETSLTTNFEDLEINADLSIVNLKNTAGIYNEPIVTLSVSTNSELDLNLYQKVNLSTSKNRAGLELDLIYTKSDEGKLFFIAKLSDRAELIKLIAAKNTMYASLSSEGEVLERISFSLRGSSNALQSRSRDSLKKACGGIETLSF